MHYFFKINYTGEINQYRKGMGITNMSAKALASVLVPLPPIAEQTRIVEKLDKLMAHCDELEANIRTSKHHAETLLQVALKEALEPNSEAKMG
jgi:type I restriction enzyme S subunit